MKKPRRNGTAPSGISPEAKRLRDKIISDYGIHDAAGILLCDQIAQAWDRLAEARAIIAREGCTQLDRCGQRKPNAACIIERDSAARLISAVRTLRLEPVSILGEEQ